MNLISIKDIDVKFDTVFYFCFLSADCSYKWLANLLDRVIYCVKESDIQDYLPNYFLASSEDLSSLYYSISRGSNTLGYIKFNRTNKQVISMKSAELLELFNEIDDNNLRLSYIIEEEFVVDDEQYNFLDIAIFNAIITDKYDCIYIPSVPSIKSLEVKLKLLSESSVDNSYYSNNFEDLFESSYIECILHKNNDSINVTMLVKRVKELAPLYIVEFIDVFSCYRHFIRIIIPDLYNKYARMILSSRNLLGIFDTDNVKVEMKSKCLSLLRDKNGNWN